MCIRDSINTLLKLREKSEEDMENELTPFGFLDTGHDHDYTQVLEVSPETASFEQLMTL